MRLTDVTQPLALATDGRFVAAVPPGRFELVAVGPAFAWCRVPLPAIAAGDSVDCGELRLPRPGVVHLSVDRTSDAPSGQSRYLLERLDVAQRIDEGRGELPDRFALAPGSYRLEVEQLPGPRRELRFALKAGEVAWLDVSVTARCRHVVHCELPDGAKPEFLWLELFDTERKRLELKRYVEPDADGTFAPVLELLQGNYRLTAVTADGQRGERELLVNTSAGEREVGIRIE